MERRTSRKKLMKPSMKSMWRVIVPVTPPMGGFENPLMDAMWNVHNAVPNSTGHIRRLISMSIMDEVRAMKRRR